MAVLHYVFSGSAVSVVSHATPHVVDELLFFVDGFLCVCVVMFFPRTTLFHNIVLVSGVFASHYCGSWQVILVVKFSGINHSTKRGESSMGWPRGSQKMSV